MNDWWMGLPPDATSILTERFALFKLMANDIVLLIDGNGIIVESTIEPSKPMDCSAAI